MAGTNTPRITFCGGIGTPTGSNFLFEYGATKILIDCGATQGSELLEDENYEPFAYDVTTIDALVVTHAHFDHVGRIPRLVKAGFTGPIYSTEPTRDIAEHVLADSVSIVKEEAERKGRDPLFTAEDVQKAFMLWKALPYHQDLQIGDIGVSLFDAGHILGSAMARITAGEAHVLFSGDLGNSPSPLLPDTEYPPQVTHLIVESVYGNRVHEGESARRKKLKQGIEDAVKMHGTLLIPAFSVERTQVLLSEINYLVEHGEIPNIPVFLDSPLAIKVTDVYKTHKQFFKKSVQDTIFSGDDIFDFPKLSFTTTVEASKAIADTPNPKIIIAGAGMSHAGRIQYHEKKLLSDPNTTVLMVGFQVPGSVGRQLIDGARTVKILGEAIPVRARIRDIGGYSAHKDVDGIVDFVSHLSNLERAFVVLGEPKASQFLTQRLRDYLGVDACMPKRGETIEIR